MNTERVRVKKCVHLVGFGKRGGRRGEKTLQRQTACERTLSLKGAINSEEFPE